MIIHKRGRAMGESRRVSIAQCYHCQYYYHCYCTDIQQVSDADISRHKHPEKILMTKYPFQVYKNKHQSSYREWDSTCFVCVVLTGYQSHSSHKGSHPGRHTLALLKGMQPLRIEDAHRLGWSVSQELGHEGGHHDGPSPASIQCLSSWSHGVKMSAAAG